jgi:predicted nucleic acid-binding protein
VKRFVLDASVALAWLLDDPVPAYALAVKRSLRNTRPLVPPLWTLEVANAIAVGERRGNLTSDQVARSMSLVEQLLGQTIEMIASAVTFRQVLTTARSLRLTAYDAVYLEIARSEAVPLATLDRALRAAAPRVGVELLSSM